MYTMYPIYDVSEALCGRCDSRIINPKYLFFFNPNSPLSGDLRDYLEIGRLDPKERDPACAMCDLLFLIKMDCHVHAENMDFVLCSRDRQRRTRIDEVPEPGSQIREYVAWCTQCAESGRLWAGFPRRDGYHLRVLASPGNGRSLSGRQGSFEPAAANFDAMRTWIDDCQAHHAKKCPEYYSGTFTVAKLMLIDCHTRTIVDAEPGWRYAALSYVWGLGRGTDQQVAKGRRLPAALLPTIEDALLVTQRLGLRYLWIDRYCIPQDDDRLRRSQMDQMDHVYQGAYITIVAAAGKDPSHGLPGVSANPRRARPQVVLGRTRLTSVRFTPHLPMKRSAWATRAWTLQEYMFSPRKLIFTDEEVYFECREHTAYESVPFEMRELTRETYRSEAIRLRGHVHDTLCEYSERLLSFDGDAIRAFAGFLHDFRNHKHPILHYWGILIWTYIYHTREFVQQDVPLSQMFVAGLCWQNARVGRRRSQFPSWSWAGWTCEVDRVQKTSQELSDACPVVLVEYPNGEKRSLDDFMAQENRPESMTHFIHLEVWAIPLDIRAHDKDKTELYPKPRLVSASADILGFHATFEDTDFTVRCSVLLNEQPLVEVRHPNLKPVFPKGEVTGLMLRGLQYDGVLLVVRKMDSHYERIGTVGFDKSEMVVISKSSGERMTDDRFDHYRDVCLRHKERSRVRLG